LLFSKKNSGKVIGIDLGTTSVKVLEFSKSGRSLVAEHYGYEPLTPGVIIDHKIKDVEAVATSVRRAIKKSGSKAKRAAVCVPSGQVISKLISIQADLSASELESLVEIEADRIVPYALDEVNIDFLHMGKSANSPGEDDVQIVVCRKSVVEDLVSVMDESDLEPSVIDVDTFTLSRVHALVNQGLVGAGARRTSAIVDFGSNNSRFMVFHNNQMVYNRDSPFGGRQLIDSINQKYGMPHDEVMMALRKGDLPVSFKTDVLKPYVKSLVQEILRALQFFYSSSTHNSINELLITGGCAQIGNLEKIIEKRLEIPTAILNPFASTRIGSKIDKDRFRKDIPSLALASGLALRGVE
jgi:type IV pilus assembly protein PilM